MGPAPGQLWDGPRDERGHIGLSDSGHPAGVGSEHLAQHSPGTSAGPQRSYPLATECKRLFLATPYF